ncbi:hypothetical protein QWM81_08245, partial [Streptomyces ficellus]|nr:hypothetical protein [Streptomyces ficellus]
MAGDKGRTVRLRALKGGAVKGRAVRGTALAAAAMAALTASQASGAPAPVAAREATAAHEQLPEGGQGLHHGRVGPRDLVLGEPVVLLGTCL